MRTGTRSVEIRALRCQSPPVRASTGLLWAVSSARGARTGPARGRVGERVVFGRRRRRLARSYERAVLLGNDSPISHGRFERCTSLGEVIGHRQWARTGVKAYVRWVVDESVTAAWFEGAWPVVGSSVLAQGSYGYGTHHGEEVFYVDPGDVEVLRATARAAYMRRRRRSRSARSTSLPAAACRIYGRDGHCVAAGARRPGPMNERRTAADFVAVICAFTATAHGTTSSVHEGVAALKGAGADELRRVVGGRDYQRNAPDFLDELAIRWEAPCLASLAVAIRAEMVGAMRQYLVACAVADACGTVRSAVLEG